MLKIKDFLSENNILYNHLIKSNEKDFLKILTIINKAVKKEDMNNLDEESYKRIYENIEKSITKENIYVKLDSISNHNKTKVCILFNFLKEDAVEFASNSFYFFMDKNSTEIEKDIHFTFDTKKGFEKTEFMVYKGLVEFASNDYGFEISYKKETGVASDNFIIDLFNFDNEKFINKFFFDVDYSKEDKTLYLLLNDSNIDSLFKKISRPYYHKLKDFNISPNLTISKTKKTSEDVLNLK
jgi:hypothetical protein